MKDVAPFLESLFEKFRDYTYKNKSKHRVAEILQISGTENIEYHPIALATSIILECYSPTAKNIVTPKGNVYC